MRDSISSNNQPWYFEDLRLGIVDPDGTGVVQDSNNRPSMTQGKLVSNVTLRAKKFLQSGFSKIKHKKLLTTLPLEAVRRLSAQYKPLSSLEQLCLSEGKNIIFLGEIGHGKTHQACLYFLDRNYASDDSYALSFLHSRGVGSTQEEKFHDLCSLMGLDNELATGYFHGEEQTKGLIRAGELKPSMLLITPQTFIGSLNKYFPIKYLENSPDYHSSNLEWGRKLASPKYLFIDEVDSFPTSTLMLMIPIVRVLKWKNPEMQIILASGTLGNPSRIARQFFGTDYDYLTIKGAGRRGQLEITAYYEEKSEIVLKERLTQVNHHIRQELLKIKRDPNYKPEKVILFINHKLSIDIQKITGQLSRNYITVHGNMEFKDIKPRLQEFRDDPTKICLVTTQIIQSGVDLPDVTWGIFYGLLKNPQQFIQLRDRINRNPDKKGRLDVILRHKNDFERSLADPNNKAELDEFLLQQKPVPLTLPLYTPFSLRIWIIMAVILGIEDILWHIGQEFSFLEGDKNFQLNLKQAVTELSRNGYICKNSEGQLISTNRTRLWVVKHVLYPTNNTSSKIIRISKNSDTEMGRVDYLTILRHHLVDQSLPFGDYNYQVKKILTRQTSRGQLQRQVYVEKIPPDIHFFKNKLTTTFEQTGVLANNPEIGIGLITIRKTIRLSELDSRTTITRSHLNVDPLVLEYPAIFVSGKTALNYVYTEEITITKLKEILKKELGISPYELELLEYMNYNDQQLGEGILIIDKSTIQLAHLMYQFLNNKIPTKENKAVTTMSTDDIQKLQYSKFKRPFHHLQKFIDTYMNTIVIFADFHLDGRSLMVDGKEVDLRVFFRYYLQFFQDVSHIFFLGDTLDWTEAKDQQEALAQLHILYEVLEEYSLRRRAVFFLGNHDYDEKLFQWRLPICVKKELYLPLPDGSHLLFTHGDQLGVEKYQINGEYTDEEIRRLRKERYIPDNRRLITGHGHNGYNNKQEKMMVVPSLKKYWCKEGRSDRGWFGLLGFTTRFSADFLETAIDA